MCRLAFRDPPTYTLDAAATAETLAAGSTTTRVAAPTASALTRRGLRAMIAALPLPIPVEPAG